MLTKKFWKGAGERALKTFMQTTFASLIAVAGQAATAWEVPWVNTVYDAVGIGLLAAFLSVGTSLGNVEFTAGRDEKYISLRLEDFSPDARRRMLGE